MIENIRWTLTMWLLCAAERVAPQGSGSRALRQAHRVWRDMCWLQLKLRGHPMTDDQERRVTAAYWRAVREQQE